MKIKAPIIEVGQVRMSQKTYDAFLSHNSKDKPVVEEIGKYLEETAKITVFLDKWGLIPGGKWQEELEKALSQSRSFVFFVGEEKPGAWQNEEMRIALDEMVTSGTIRIVPVLLPGGKQPEKESRLPGFLRQRTWVEFKNQWHEPDALNRLVCGIKGVPPHTEKTVRTARLGVATHEIQCPFRGLEVFREEDREFFFGREAIVQRLMTRLRDARFLAVVGPSGVGKSSIVQAGLIPRLHGDSMVALFTPRMDPIEELAFALLMGCRHDAAAVKTPVEEWVKRMNVSPDALHFIAREALEPLKSIGKKRWILVVDQLEELFTQTRSEEDRRKFIALLLKAVEKEEGPVAVIVTMRSDFLGKCAYYPDLNVYVTDYLEQIGPMGREELKSALEEPAHAVGLQFEEGLVNRILEDAGGGAGELPLVEHALLELFTDKKDGYLTMAAYIRIGGIAGALTQRAEEEFGKLADNEKEILRNMFVLRLVQPGEGTEDTRRRAVKEELLAVGGDKEAAGAILKKWTDARLLTIMHDPVRNQDMVDAAHESLIRKWDRIKQWMAEGREVSRQTGILRQAAREWEQADKNPDFLYQGARLAQLETLLDSHAEDLTDMEKEFIRAGVERREWEQRQEKERTEELLKARARVIRRSRVILVVVLIALMGMGYLWYQSNKNKINAQRLLAMIYRGNADVARKDGDSLKTLYWLAEAAALTPDRVSRNDYLRNMMNGLWSRNELLHIFKHERAVKGAVFNRDETLILTWDSEIFYEKGTARLWEAATGKPIIQLITHDSRVDGAVFNRDETKILTWGGNFSLTSTVRLWEIGSGRSIGADMTYHGNIDGAVFNRDETKILTWGMGNNTQTGSARLWEAGTGKSIGEPMTHNGTVRGAVFNRDETRILTWSGDTTARLWEGGTGKLIGALMKHDDWVRGAKFSRDETKILTWSSDNTAQLWEAETGKPIGEPMRHDGDVNGAVFNHDETKILTWSDDNTARLWEAGTGKSIGPPMKHNDDVYGAVFNRDETRILTRSDDKTARLWEVETGKPIGAPMTHNDAVRGAVFNRDETRILSWSVDKTARLWETETGKPIGPPMTHNDAVRGAVFNRDETKILTWSGDKCARLWGGNGAVFNIDKTKVTTRSQNKTAQSWVMGVDWDFPLDLLTFQIAALTGTEFDPTTGAITFMDPERFEKLKAEYLEKAASHYKSCKYKNANIFHRFYPEMN